MSSATLPLEHQSLAKAFRGGGALIVQKQRERHGMKIDVRSDHARLQAAQLRDIAARLPLRRLVRRFHLREPGPHIFDMCDVAA